jgi:hypothetical protein
LSIAARVIRKSLKEEARLKAEKRGPLELKFAKWEVGYLQLGMLDVILTVELCRTESRERPRTFTRTKLLRHSYSLGLS